MIMLIIYALSQIADWNTEMEYSTQKLNTIQNQK